MARTNLGPASTLTRITAFCLLVGFYLACTAKDEVTGPTTASVGSEGQATIMASPSNIRSSPSGLQPSPSDIRSSPGGVRPSPSDIRSSPDNVRTSPAPNGPPTPGPSPSGSPSGPPSVPPSGSPTPPPTKFVFKSGANVSGAGLPRFDSLPINVNNLTGTRILYSVVTFYLTVSDANVVGNIDLNIPSSGPTVFARVQAAADPDFDVTGPNLGSGCPVGNGFTSDPFAPTPVSSGSTPYSDTFRAFRSPPVNDLTNVWAPVAATNEGQWTVTFFSATGTPFPAGTRLNCWEVDVFTVQ